MQEPLCLPIPFPFDPIKGDVYCVRVVAFADDPDAPSFAVPKVSIPQEIYLWPNVGMNWGGTPEEGVTLALNLLHRIIPQGGEWVCDDWHFPLACCPLAFRAAWSFYLSAVVHFPFWGTVVKGENVRGWVARHTKAGYIHLEGARQNTPRHIWPEHSTEYIGSVPTLPE